jgi:hypothetical protein
MQEYRREDLATKNAKGRKEDKRSFTKGDEVHKGFLIAA